MTGLAYEITMCGRRTVAYTRPRHESNNANIDVSLGQRNVPLFVGAQTVRTIADKMDERVFVLCARICSSIISYLHSVHVVWQFYH